MPGFFTRLLLLALLALPMAAQAQWGVIGDHPVTVSAKFEPAEVRAGEEVTLTVTATVDSKYHIYAMRFSSDKPGPIPTEILLSDEIAEQLIPTSVWEEPTVTTKFDLGFERDVEMLFGSPLVFTRTYQVRPDVAAGDLFLDGIFYVQACTETSCLPPAEISFEASIRVTAGDGSISAATPVLDKLDGVDTSATDQPAIVVVGGVENQLAGTSFGGFLLASFLFGLIALATPCVFPMIPITISFFTKNAGNSTGRAAVNAGVYVISIIAGFTLIGFGISLLMLALGGGVESGGFAQRLASDPWVNLFFAVLYITFALGLFGAFEFRLPASISSRLSKEATGRTDFVGIALKAMVFVVISFTCTAPLVGVLIVQTLSGEWTRPLFGMMAFATGFALPFFILALAPQMISSLPKAGGWLYSVKIVMGLLVLAAAFKFISNTDIVLFKENMIFTRELLLAVWAAIAAVIAFYLFGFLRLKEDEEASGIGVGRLLTGTTFAVFALYLSSGLFGGRLHGWVDAYLPPDLSPAPLVATAGGAPQSDPNKMFWYDNVEEAMAVAQRENKPVFIDFTGYSCTNCRLMEKNMFPRPEIASRLSEYIRVKLYTDDRQVGAKHREYQARTFNTVALPFYAVLDQNGNILAKAEYTTDVQGFAQFLDAGLKTEVAGK